MNYSDEKRFTLPSKFTAINGAAQTFELESNVTLAGDAGQADLLRVLEVLRSNGAQPIVTSVAGAKVTFTVEQVWCYGARGASARNRTAAELETAALADIAALFTNIKAVSDSTKNLFKAVVLKETIGSLEA